MSSLRQQIKKEGLAILEAYPNNGEIKRQLDALVNSLDDTLTDRQVLEELRAIRETGYTFLEIFAGKP